MELPEVLVTFKGRPDTWLLCSESCLLFYMLGRAKLTFSVQV